MSNRPSLGFDDDEENIPATPPKADLVDLSGFQPKQVVRPDKQKTAEAAAKSNFKSRESKPALATVSTAEPPAISHAPPPYRPFRPAQPQVPPRDNRAVRRHR